MATSRITLLLDPTIEFEQHVISTYAAMSRGRRQEWLRALLRTALCATSEGPAGREAGLSIVPGPVQRAAARALPLATVKADLLMSLDPVATAPSTAHTEPPVAPAAPVKTVQRSASVLRGFLPEPVIGAKPV